MTKSFTMLALLLLGFCSLRAQQKKLMPWGAAEIGLVGGSAGVTYDARLQGGLTSGSWRWGLGSGYDNYRFASVPVFAQGRRYFGKKNLQPFLLASTGVSIPASRPPEGMWTQGDLPTFPSLSSNLNYHAGAYAEAGAGISFFSKSDCAFELSLLYNRKTMKETFLQYVYDGSEANQVENWNRYRMNRIVVRLGIRI